MSNVKRIIKDCVIKYKWTSLLLVCVVFASVVISLLPPQILKVIIDDYLMNANHPQIFTIAMIYFVAVAFSGLCDLLREMCLVIFGQKMTEMIRSKMMTKLSNLPYTYFSNHDSGQIVSRFNNDVDAIQALFTNGIIGMAIDGLKIIGIMASILIFSKSLFLILLCVLPIICLITRKFQTNVLKAQIKNRKYIAVVNNFIPETINNIQMIKSFGIEKYMEDKYLKSIQNSYDVVEKINFYDSIFSPIVLVIKTVVISVIAVLSCNDLQWLGISIGTVAASIELISNIFKPIENLGMELQNIQQSVAGIKRVEEFLNEQEDENKNNILANDVQNSMLDGTITFENVDFEYAKGQPVLQNFNLNIKSKESVTFIGRTGAGKSTCFKLVLGLLSPTKGKVCICNTETTKIPNSEKRKIFGYVEQSFHQVSGTIKDQVTLHDKSITNEAVDKALQLVGLKDYISNFHNGINTKVDDTTFSFGQRQLLSIARAIVNNPPILLLDEMSANLDVETEKQIVEILQTISENCTIISISHRLSSVLKNNRIVDITSIK